MKKTLSILALVAVIAIAYVALSKRKAGNVITNADGQSLILELSSENVLHFAWFPKPADGQEPREIPATIMVAKNEKARPLERSGDNFESASFNIRVDRGTLCFSVVDKVRNFPAGNYCPVGLTEKAKGMSIDAKEMQNAYGLGEQFLAPGVTDGDWVGKVRDSGVDAAENNRGQHYGNNMHAYNGGSVSNATFPILYAVGEGSKNFAVFFDNTMKQRWDLTAQPWKVETTGGGLQGYLILGDDLPALRTQYMNLTGHAPVPPRKAFGLWVSEYGFENWAELEGKLKTLRANKFPIDGFVLDLQWFGGIVENSEKSMMGALTWDLKNFPDPAGKIAAYKKDEDLGIIAIEEPYISKGPIDKETGRPVHDILEEKGYLATEKSDSKKASFIAYNPWWGRGGIYDYINDEAAAFMHDWRRKALIDVGLIGHWTDLGEPEMFEPVSYYDNGRFEHPQVHNIYNIKWSKSIWDGYQRHNEQKRPWILSRSGTSGIQRFGVSMWSGDIGANLKSLAAHLNTQMHMSFSGLDYFGSDIGGFHRKGLDGDPNEMYTQWFAVGTALEFPVRAHTFNLQNKFETAPDRIGDRASNLFNLRQRYALNPYYYSLAHIAFERGEPIVAPLVYYHQTDMPARQLGDHKLIGKDLLVATISRIGQKETRVYLPKGKWYDYRSGKVIDSTGDWLEKVSAYDGKIFRLPMYARAGAIFPQARVTENTRSTTPDGEMVFRIYPSTTATEFTLTEDDGETVGYRSGKVRKTKISQSEDAGGTVKVEIAAAQGAYDGAAESANYWVEIASGGREPMKVRAGDTELKEVKSDADLAKAERGWRKGDNGLIIAKVSDQKRAESAVVQVEFK